MPRRASPVTLVPLLREGADDVERALLSSAQSEVPSDPQARARTLAALKEASRAAAAAGAGTLAWRWLLRALVPARVPWVAVGGVAGLVTAGGAILVSEALSPRPTSPTKGASTAIVAPPAAPSGRPASAPPPGLPAPAPDRPALPSPPANARVAPSAARAASPSPSGEAILVPAWPDEEPAPVAPVATGGASVQTSPSSPPSSAPPEALADRAPASSSLHEEASLLESARAAMAAAKPASALAALDQYDARFPAGTLSEEAAVLRVQALLAAHRPAEARRVTEDFARRRPSSAYVPRMRALVGRE